MRIALFALAVAAVSGYPAQAQLRLAGPAPVLSEGGLGNIFVDWDAEESLAESTLRLPPGWKLLDATLLRHGRRSAVSWSSDAGEADYRIIPADPEPGPLRLVLRVEAPDYVGRGFWSLTPGIRVEHDGDMLTGTVLREPAVTEPLHLDESNLVAVFDRTTRVELGTDDLPMYRGDRSYTVEFWFSTTGLGEIVLSSWNGDEHMGYPIELVVAPDGRLRYFRGEPGRHVSMSSRVPVADGRWHHVAVVHDEVRGWTRLLIDSLPTDSLSGQTRPVLAGSRTGLCLGGRCESEADSPAGRAVAFSGRLDLLRIWPTARTVRQITASMGEEIPPVAGMIAIGFDAAEARSLDVAGDDIRLEPSDFLFFDPVDDLTASMEENAVLIEWESGGRNTAWFVVERSVDGEEFSELGRVAPEARHAHYAFEDADPPHEVAYYRVQQVLGNGGTRPSGTLKVGLAGDELPSAIRSLLVGNFPNPFSDRTTVRYEVFEQERVSVSVWDLSGHQVALLADGMASPGVHEVSFEAGDLPSGTYFVHLQTDQGVSTKTLTLTR